LFHAGIYIGWVGHLNLGDEALYDLCLARYPSISWSLWDTLDDTARPSQFRSLTGKELTFAGECAAS